MKPARFAYHAPRALDEALALLHEHADEGKVLAGGQSLVPLMNFRLARPAVLVDLNRVQGLDHLAVEEGALRIGALVRQRRVEREPVVATRVPLLARAMPHIGHEAIRTRGTICGSLAHADPAAELPAVAVALDAVMVAARAGGRREIPAAEFFLGYLTTALAPDEILVECRIPVWPEAWRWTFVEVARRSGDFALAGLAAGVRRDGGAIREARLAFTGVGSGPVRAALAEAALVSDGVAAAVEAARAAVDPESDLHASREFRIHLAGVLVKQAVEELTR